MGCSEHGVSLLIATYANTAVYLGVEDSHVAQLQRVVITLGSDLKDTRVITNSMHVDSISAVPALACHTIVS